MGGSGEASAAGAWVTAGGRFLNSFGEEIWREQGEEAPPSLPAMPTHSGIVLEDISRL